MTEYADLHHIEENERIRLIGEAVMAGQTIGVLLESQKLDAGKIKRYLRKLAERYPMVELVSRKPGPVKNVEALRFRKKLQ